MGQLYQLLFYQPILNLLVVFYKVFEFLQIPGPLGFAVIALTAAIRLFLYPLMATQMKSAKKMATLKPHLDVISQKHKNDKQALQQAQLALYKEHGVNPAAGCLPMLIQLPVLIALYGVFNQVLNNGNLGKVVEQLNAVVYTPALKLSSLDLSFLGINLGIKPSQWQTQGLWLLSIPVITGLLQWYQTKLMMPTQPSAIGHSPRLSHGEAGEPLADKKKTPDHTLKSESGKQNAPTDTAMEMQKQMAVITPIMFGYFALQFPLGLALYWNVFGLFGIMQQIKINKST